MRVVLRTWMALWIGLCGLVALAGEPHQLKPISENEIAKIKAALPEKATAVPVKPRKLLVFWKCEGFFHSAIPYGAKAIELMGEKTGAYTTVVSDDMAMFDPERIEQFDAIVFNNTTALKFQVDKKPDDARRQALLNFVNKGKGVVGIHGATDNFYAWPEGAALIGALFNGHPWGQAPVKLDDPSHPLLKAFGGKAFWVRDEMYRMKEPYSRENLRVLLSFDYDKMDKQSDSRADKDNPIAWIQQVGEGRSFYCSLGHQHEIFWTPAFLQFYLDGIQYALGDLKADATPSAKLNPQPQPLLPPEKPEWKK